MNRVLIVDDEPDTVTSMQVGLRRMGFQVDSFTSSTDALFNYVPGTYQLIIADVRMSKIDGFELVRKIREVDPDIKVRFLTAYDIRKDDFEKVFPQMDYSLLIQKPISIKKLADVVRCALESG